MSANEDVVVAAMRAWTADITAEELHARVDAIMRISKRRIGSAGVAAARARRTRTAMRHLERRADRRCRREGRWLERAIARHGAIEMLCWVVRRAGLTMTLHGRPVDAKQLRASAEVSVVERLRRAVEGPR